MTATFTEKGKKKERKVLVIYLFIDDKYEMIK